MGYREPTSKKSKEMRRIVNKRYNDSHKELYKAINEQRTKQGKHAAYHLKSRYGVTQEEWMKRIALQEGKCAICNLILVTDTKRHRLSPVMDHDHACCDSVKTCGKCLRGVLCTTCNKAIGMLQENTEVMRRAIAYLEGYHLDKSER